MDQTATGLLVIGWKQALALIAGIPIVTAFGVFLLARFTHMFDSYAGERAKLLAQFHNLDKLVEQTERLTVTSEIIKARISDGMWDRQMRWSYLRDVYVSLVDAIGQMRTAHAGRRALEELRLNRDLSDPANAWIVPEIDKTVRQWGEAIGTFTKVRDTAFLVLPEKPYRILYEMGPKLRPIREGHWLEDLDANIDTIQTAFNSLIMAARMDLGFSVTPESLPTGSGPKISPGPSA